MIICNYPGGCIALAMPGKSKCTVHDHAQCVTIGMSTTAYLNWVYAEPLDDQTAHRIPRPWDDYPHWTERRLRRLRALSGRTSG